METVLIVGATGNVGVSVATAALRSGRKVLAVVRNQQSAEKLFKHVGTKDGITVAEADVLAEDGVQEVVDRVKAGELPAFHHVYVAVGALQPKSPIQDLTTDEFRAVMNTSVESSFFAYRATIPYLLTAVHPTPTWTLITGGAGTVGWGGVTAISQGALFSMARVANRENATTNIRFNEVYLCCRVDYDSVAEAAGAGPGERRVKGENTGRRISRACTRGFWGTRRLGGAG